MRKSPYNLSNWGIGKTQSPQHIRPHRIHTIFTKEKNGEYTYRPATDAEEKEIAMQNEYLTPKERAQKERKAMKTVEITVKADSYWSIAKMLHEVARKIWFEAWPSPMESQTGIVNSKPPFVPATHGHHLNEDGSSIQWNTIVETDAREGSTGARW